MSSSDSSRPRHRRAVSSPHHPTRKPHNPQEDFPLIRASQSMASTSELASTFQPQRPRAASRIMLSVKRSLTPSSLPKKRHPEYSKSGMLSTREESSASIQPQPFRDLDPTASRPTVEQIAMGLHTSRTPHLRPLASSSYAFSQRNSAPHSARPYEHHHQRATPMILPPPPPRSSLKKPSATVTSSSSSPAVSTPFSSASGSSTTVTSLTPSASQTPKSFSGIKFRMARFLPHSRSTSAPTSMVNSPMASPRQSTSEAPQARKAVRFHTEESTDDD